MDEFVTVGMTVEEARAAAATHGCSLRVFDASAGGFATGDVKQNRLNVEAEDGVITAVLWVG